MKRVTVRLPEEQYDALEELVEGGEYPSKSEAIREAIRELLDEKDIDVDTTRRNRQTARGQGRGKWDE